MKKCKVVFLDWNGTLSASKFWGHLEDKSHPRSNWFEKIETSLFGNLRSLIKPWMRGSMKSEDVIEQISADSKIEYKELFNEFKISCEKMKFVSKEINNLIRDIRKENTSVVIATDNMDSFTRWTVSALKLDKLFDDILSSYELGGMKSDVDITGKSIFFEDYLKRNRISHGESLIIDDSEDKDGKVQGFGIDYHKIEPVKGLVPELKSVLSSIRSFSETPRTSPNTSVSDWLPSMNVT